MLESFYTILAVGMRYAFVLILALLFLRMAGAALAEHRQSRHPDSSVYCGVLETVRGGESIHYGITRDNVIGRSRRCDIAILRNRSVPPVAAHLYWSRDGWLIYSLRRGRTLRVNGSAVSGRARLQHGDTVQLGSVVLRLCLYDGEEA